MALDNQVIQNALTSEFDSAVSEFAQIHDILNYPNYEIYEGR